MILLCKKFENKKEILYQLIGNLIIRSKRFEYFITINHRVIMRNKIELNQNKTI